MSHLDEGRYNKQLVGVESKARDAARSLMAFRVVPMAQDGLARMLTGMSGKPVVGEKIQMVRRQALS